jgi:regulator of telomere elongation helicase 1
MLVSIFKIVFTVKSVSNSHNDEKITKKGAEDYKVHFKMENNKTRVLCYWCFSPSQTMEELINEGARCIILTSGTLSPIGSLKIEMKM